MKRVLYVAFTFALLSACGMNYPIGLEKGSPSKSSEPTTHETRKSQTHQDDVDNSSEKSRRPSPKSEDHNIEVETDSSCPCGIAPGAYIPEVQVPFDQCMSGLTDEQIKDQRNCAAAPSAS